ncbi:acetyltransferase [Arthrobacter sp. lap29]|uniref:acetyltransferase n=1 Tax=Arthrobacter sp. lap29 TaxID=3056122 RepID=UPI0028F7096D|nr:acetyltransferase [Arthrobacter sp. lap29]
MGQLILVAASGLAREVLVSLQAAGKDQVVGFLDDDPALAGTLQGGVPVLGPLAEAGKYPDVRFVICAGKGAIRERIANQLADLGVGAGRFATVIAATATVPGGTAVGEGSILLANVVLTADVRVGRHVVIMPQVTLTHDCELEDFATLTAGVSLGGGVRIGRGAYLGMNSSVRERRTIGAGATVGMGAAVVNDVPSGETWVGVPARPLATMGREADKRVELGRLG